MLAVLAALASAEVAAQATNDPFPEPIEANRDIIVVDFEEFASLPDIEGQPARMMTLTTVAGTTRLFVSDMRGPIYAISSDGQDVTEYVNVDDEQWGVPVQSASRERGIQSIAFHPQFNEAGSPGYGKFYTWLDTSDQEPEPDFTAGDGGDSHDTVLLEWTANNPAARVYDGGAPREVMRFQQPFPNHNGGHIAFRPDTEPGDEDYGLLYIGVGDGGSGGDPFGTGQNLGIAFGKLLRIDPLGSNSANGKYGIPPSNPFVDRPGALGEIYAYGIRNPQRYEWDSATGNLFLADVGQNTVEELSLVTPGANLGWNLWEGSFRFLGREGVDLADPRSDDGMTYPTAEYDQRDPLLQNASAATGVYIARTDAVPAIRDLILWGDMPSGEIFYIPTDPLPEGGQEVLRRILFNDGGETRTFLELVQAKNAEQGRDPAPRADMRMNTGPNGELMLLNKYDGTIRVVR